MKSKRRKAFTLVELLIVIAIVAVLSVVGLVGYSSFQKKAYISNDEAIIAQMNTILQGYETLDEASRNCDEAVNQCYENGFDYEQLEPQSKGYHFVYDIDNNRFALLDDKMNLVYCDSSKPLTEETNHIFVLKNIDTEISSENEDKYAIYVAGKYVDQFVAEMDQENKTENKEDAERIICSGEKVLMTFRNVYKNKETDDTNIERVIDYVRLDLQPGVSLDLGKNDNYVITYYENLEDTNDGEGYVVDIRTYGGQLIVNAPYDTINHYDFAAIVNVIDVDYACYNEYGRIGRLIYQDDCVLEVNDDGTVLKKEDTGGKIVFMDTAYVSCYMNTSNDEKQNATEGRNKDANATVITNVSVSVSYDEENKEIVEKHNIVTTTASFDLDEDAILDFTSEKGLVSTVQCLYHNKDYQIVDVGETSYIVCNACGAYSLHDGTTHGEPTKTNLYTPLTEETKEVGEFVKKVFNAKDNTQEEYKPIVVEEEFKTKEKESIENPKEEHEFNAATDVNVSLSGPSDVKVGSTIKLIATVTSNSGLPFVSNVIWSSSDNSIATVDSHGNVKGIKAGTVIITATSVANNECYETKLITVIDTNTHSDPETPTKVLKIDRTSLGIGDGEIYKFSSNVSGVTWKSNDTDVCTIDSNGKLKAIDPGTATITAHKDGYQDATCEVTVWYFHNGNWDWSYKDQTAPSEIANAEQWINMIYSGEDGYGSGWAGYTLGAFKLVDDIDLSDIELPATSNYRYIYSYSGFYLDGNYKTIKNGSGITLFGGKQNGDEINSTYYYMGEAVIKNLKVNGFDADMSLFGMPYYGSNVTFENVDVFNCTANLGLYCDQIWSGEPTVNWVNCDVVNCEVNGGYSGVAVFSGYLYNGSKMNVSGCTVKNTKVVASSGPAGGIVAQNNSASSNVVVTNTYFAPDCSIIAAGEGATVAAFDAYKNTNYASDKSNAFLGSISSDNKNVLNGFDSSIYHKFSSLKSEDFNIDDNGYITYNGNLEFDRISIREFATRVRYNSQPTSIGYTESGMNFSWNNIIECDINDISNTLYKLSLVKNVVNVTSRAYKDKIGSSILNNGSIDWQGKVAYYDATNHTLYFKSYENSDENCMFVSGSASVDKNGNITAINNFKYTVYVELSLYNGDKYVGTTTLPYTFIQNNY